jgi:hypothetical protein
MFILALLRGQATSNLCVLLSEPLSTSSTLCNFRHFLKTLTISFELRVHVDVCEKSWWRVSHWRHREAPKTEKSKSVSSKQSEKCFSTSQQAFDIVSLQKYVPINKLTVVRSDLVSLVN